MRWLIDTLLWKSVSIVEFEDEVSVLVLERHRLKGNYRVTRGLYNA